MSLDRADLVILRNALRYVLVHGAPCVDHPADWEFAITIENKLNYESNEEEDSVTKKYDEFFDRMLDNIERTGRTVVGVFPDKASTDPTNDAFAYSVGNAFKGLPELLVVGMYNDSLINHLSEIMIKRGRKFDDGELVDLGGAVPVCLIDAAEMVKERYTFQATYLMGGEDKYQVMQIVAPDKNGKFPWQQGCAEPYSRVNVYRRMQLN